MLNLRLSHLAAGALIALAALAGACTPQNQPQSPLAQDIRRERDPVVAAKVNGKPIYVDDVTVEAVVRGEIKLGEELDPTSDAFYQILQDLIETRLLAQEAEARGLDKTQDVKHRLEIARERILANVLNQNLQDQVLTDEAIKRFYRENVKVLGRGALVHARHILTATREQAIAAKNRIERGESFDVVAYEVSIDRVSGGEGGDLGFRTPESYPEALQEAMREAPPNAVQGPVQSDIGWHLIKVVERRAQEPPSIESMRKQLEANLWFPEQRRIVERLRSSARVELFVDESRKPGKAPGPGLAPPADGGATALPRPVAPPIPIPLPTQGEGEAPPPPRLQPAPQPQAPRPQAAPRPPAQSQTAPPPLKPLIIAPQRPAPAPSAPVIGPPAEEIPPADPGRET